MFKTTGGFKIEMNPSWEDYEFWLNCAEHGAKWRHVDQTLFVYHPNPSGRGVEARDQERLLRGKLEGFHPETYEVGRGVVAVIIPLYKQEQWVGEAIQSVKDQIYPHVKIIVVDDASPGDFSGTDHDGYEVLRHDINRGLSAARNTGIRYAIGRYNAQYFVCLDADDRLRPEYIEQTIPWLDPKEYVYTDLQFIGDASHTFQLSEFDCSKLSRRQQHPSTFLAPTRMWQDVVQERGFGYDKGMTLRVGYEDLEFTLACVESGWGARRLAEYLFEYRYHNDGSMRTRAQESASKLVEYIHSKHLWVKSPKGVQMACKSCGGGGRYTGSTRAASTPGLGTVPGGEPLVVTYTGNAGGVLTKQGKKGRVYRPSKYNREFFIDAVDASLFARGPYVVQAVNPDPQADNLGLEISRPSNGTSSLQTLPGLGKASIQKLTAAGILTVQDVAESSKETLQSILGRRLNVRRVLENARHAVGSY